MIELASEVVNFIVNNIGLIFSLVALVLSFLSYRNSKLVKKKNDKDALYKFKTEALLKAREFEIAFQDSYDKIDGFIKELQGNNSLSLANQQSWLGNVCGIPALPLYSKTMG